MTHHTHHSQNNVCCMTHLKTASTALLSRPQEHRERSSLVSSWWRTCLCHVHIQKNGCSKTAPSSFPLAMKHTVSTHPSVKTHNLQCCLKMYSMHAPFLFLPPSLNTHLNTPILQFYYINAVQSDFLSGYGGFQLNASLKKTVVFHLN